MKLGLRRSRRPGEGDAGASAAGLTATAGGLLGIVVVTLALIFAVQVKTKADWASAIDAYRRESHDEARRAADLIGFKIRHIQQDLRTISLLPSVRRIDRHGENLSEDAHQSIQQLYNNLKTNVDVSEVYIVPQSLDPERLDPDTGEPEAPILMFDELIVDAARKARESGMLTQDGHAEADDPEVEIFEYRALVDQMAWLRARFPTDIGFSGIDRPMLSTPELITCDNTDFIHTRRDADRFGIIISVPFYGPEGALKGVISAIVRTNALVGYLPDNNHALVNTTHAYQAVSRTPGVASAAMAHVARGQPDPRLIYSEALNLDLPDPQGGWILWAGRPDSDFLNSAAARAIRAFERRASVVIGLAALLAAFGVLALRSRLQMQRSREILEKTIEARTNEVKLLEQAKTEVEASEKRAMHLAYHDALTGLPNRARLWDRMAHALEVSRRGGAAFALLCIDLDQFKGVNDSFGHHTGDELIRKVATSLSSVCRSADTLARLGGDEFAIVQLGASPASAAALAARIVEMIAQPFEISVGRVHVGCSVGVTLIQDASVEPSEVLRQADMALYRAKSEGRGRFSFFEPEMDAAIRTRRALQTDLKLALTENTLELAYQPQVNGSGAIVGLEALIRWRHPQRGMIAPSQFIPIAEECGLIVELGFFILRRAFEEAGRWPVKVAINVSAHQVRLRDFTDQVAALMAETKVTSDQFEIELTEGVLMGDDPATHATLQGLREMGFTIALDDFGTGYSSLSYLQRYPINKIKIDRAFTCNLGNDPEATAVVAAIVKLARALRLDVIAEGVETAEQRAALAKVGCTDVQGYLTGKPMAAGEIDELLRGRKTRRKQFSKAA